MSRYLAVRLYSMGLTLAGLTVLVFLMLRLVPGTVVEQMIGADAVVSQAMVDELKRFFGLDQPWYVQYFAWVGRPLEEFLRLIAGRGEFGPDRGPETPTKSPRRRAAKNRPRLRKIRLRGHQVIFIDDYTVVAFDLVDAVGYPQRVQRGIVTHVFQRLPPGGTLLVVEGFDVLEAGGNTRLCCLAVPSQGFRQHRDGRHRIGPNGQIAREAAHRVVAVEGVKA